MAPRTITLARTAAAFAVALLMALASTTDAAEPMHGAWGVDLTDQDPAVRPGDDFALYQNGGWIARTQLGPHLATAAYWRDLRVQTPARLSALLRDLTSAEATSPRDRKAADFYRAAMDVAAAEAKGLAPLKAELDAISAVRTRTEMARLIGAVEGPGTLRAPSVRANPGRGVFTIGIGQDQADPTHYAVYLGQGGLMLAGPEYYADPGLSDIKSAYRAYVAQMLGLIGWPEPDRNAAEIVAFESKVAAVSWPHERMLDPTQTYNPVTLAQLQRLAPGFDWRAYMAGAELGQVRRVIIDARGAFPAIARIYADTPLEVLKARQAFATADIGAGRLNAATYAASVAFHARSSQALLSLPDRAFDAEKWLEICMPDAVGALYVARYSSPEAKRRAEAMAAGLKSAMDRRLATLTWMSPQARNLARAKLAAMRIKVGYPDAFRTYDGLTIKADDFYGDVTRTAAYEWRRQVSRLGQPFDRSEWTLTPMYPQYGYSPASNAVEIPAALLQPPFFDLNADDAVNYGAVGTTIAAQIVAGFASPGINFDAAGRLRPWLPPGDGARFAALSRQLAVQYSAVEALPGLPIKGELVVGEAIADLGAMQIALDAYHDTLHGRPPGVLDGYSGDQRFFLGRAQMWRAKFSVDFTRNQIATGGNAPPFMRINGPIRNIDAWYAAFSVKPGDRLYLAPEDRVRFW